MQDRKELKILEKLENELTGAWHYVDLDENKKTIYQMLVLVRQQLKKFTK